MPKESFEELLKRRKKSRNRIEYEIVEMEGLVRGLLQDRPHKKRRMRRATMLRAKIEALEWALGREDGKEKTAKEIYKESERLGIESMEYKYEGTPLHTILQSKVIALQWVSGVELDIQWNEPKIS